MKIAFHTLGCKVNQYETQAMRELFISRGYELVGEEDFSDIYVINTCTVTGLSDKKSRQYIRRVKRINPESVTAVIGCYVQVSPEAAAQIEGVDIVAGTNEKTNLPDYIDEFLSERLKITRVKTYDELREYEEMGIITSMDGRTRAFIKVQEGCNQFCSYCIIPYARGPVRSRAVRDIISEAESLISKGFKEIVLTGINTALYGSENFGLGLSEVIGLLSAIPGEFRIRLGSLEPTVVDVAYSLRLMAYDKLCHHMHLSVQSGSDRILARMNRNYTTEAYKKILRVLKNHDSGYGITTDIIVGFPGETESDFIETLKLVEEFDFCKVHVFKYSKRSGTKAADMPEHLDSEIKAYRSRELIKAAAKSTQRFFEANIGTVRTALIEGYDDNNRFYNGLTDNYIKVYLKSESENPEASILNTFIQVNLEEIYEDGLLAGVHNLNEISYEQIKKIALL